ncbi:MAG: AAA family ATPase [Thermoplasmatota archaeon]
MAESKHDARAGTRSASGSPVSRIIDTVAGAWVGDPLTLRKVMAAAIADGHVAFEDDPGLGKTLLVKAFGRAVGCKATRLQFTPDLLPADVTGTKIWDPSSRDFRVVHGPIFTNVLLADEINRAPPRTQSALLEAMSDRQVTIEGDTIPLEPPFLVMATLNPLEEEGTYPLPIAQWDRFLLRMTVGYPRSSNEEVEILRRRLSWGIDDPTPTIPPAVDREEFLELMAQGEATYVHPDLLQWMADIVRAIRDRPEVEAGPSPRGTLALLRVSRGMAVVAGRRYVTPDDIRPIAVEALAHRILLSAEAEAQGIVPADIVAQGLAAIPPPPSGPPSEMRALAEEQHQAHAETRGASPTTASRGAPGGTVSSSGARVPG